MFYIIHRSGAIIVWDITIYDTTTTTTNKFPVLSQIYCLKIFYQQEKKICSHQIKQI